MLTQHFFPGRLKVVALEAAVQSCTEGACAIHHTAVQDGILVTVHGAHVPLRCGHVIEAHAGIPGGDEKHWRLAQRSEGDPGDAVIGRTAHLVL